MKITPTAQLRRFLAIEDILIGFSDGIDHPRLEAALMWAKTGGPANQLVLDLFASRHQAAKEEAGWRGNPAKEAMVDIAKIEKAEAEEIQPAAWLRDAHEGEGDECLVPAAEGDPGAFPVYCDPAGGEMRVVPRRPTDKEIGEMLYNINRKRSAGKDLTEFDVREVMDNYFYNVGQPGPAGRD